jgi:hypothetical protein
VERLLRAKDFHEAFRIKSDIFSLNSRPPRRQRCYARFIHFNHRTLETVKAEDSLFFGALEDAVIRRNAELT